LPTSGETQHGDKRKITLARYLPSPSQEEGKRLVLKTEVTGRKRSVKN